MSDLLTIENLDVSIRTGGVDRPAVRDLSLSVSLGEVVAIVGESGSGKSLTALSLMGLLPPRIAKVRRGKIIFDGRDLAPMSQRALNDVRGDSIGMIFQEPLTSLNPVMRIGDQIVEGLLARGKVTRKQAHELALRSLYDVRLSDPERRLRQYPHELSGGMRQRVMIALALISSPKLLIADEPTTALDVTVQAQILSLLKTLQQERGMALVIITHDLGIVADIADRVAVMYAGQIVEIGSAEKVLSSPSHPYGVGLLSCQPEFSGAGRRLNVIPGTMPALKDKIVGCRFKSRCPKYSAGPCDEEIPLRAVDSGHLCRCQFPVGSVSMPSLDKRSA